MPLVNIHVPECLLGLQVITHSSAAGCLSANPHDLYLFSGLLPAGKDCSLAISVCVVIWFSSLLLLHMGENKYIFKAMAQKHSLSQTICVGRSFRFLSGKWNFFVFSPFLGEPGEQQQKQKPQNKGKQLLKNKKQTKKREVKEIKMPNRYFRKKNVNNLAFLRRNVQIKRELKLPRSLLWSWYKLLIPSLMT